jgi:hypothetical protein
MSDVRALAEARESDLAGRVSRLEERVGRLEQA